jgi:agmatinase
MSGRFQANRRGEVGYTGVGLTYGRSPVALDPSGLVGADVAILGAPFDEGVSYRPGTRFGPRAIRRAEDTGFPAERPSMELGVDPFSTLDIVDYGDIEAVPADLAASHASLHAMLGEIYAAGAISVVLGGDHSLSLPTLRALADRWGPDGYSVIHFDTHADTGEIDVESPHGRPFREAVHVGAMNGANIVQVGLRGAWPFPSDFQWMREAGFRWHTMGDILDRGLATVVRDAIAYARERAPRTYLTIDIDVLDPAFAPGTGTPEPGGMTSLDLLWACREVASSVDLAGADLVEVIPSGVGSADITALVAERIVRELLTGIALGKTRAG